MELDAKIFALIVLFFVGLVWLLWGLSDDGDKDLDEFWESLTWKDEVDDEEETDRHKSRKK